MTVLLYQKEDIYPWWRHWQSKDILLQVFSFSLFVLLTPAGSSALEQQLPSWRPETRDQIDRLFNTVYNIAFYWLTQSDLTGPQNTTNEKRLKKSTSPHQTRPEKFTAPTAPWMSIQVWCNFFFHIFNETPSFLNVYSSLLAVDDDRYVIALPYRGEHSSCCWQRKEST